MQTKVSDITLPFEIKHEHRRHLLGSQPMIFHCHHYNSFLQQTIRDASYIDSRPFLIGAAEEVGFGQLSNIFRDLNIGEVEERKQWAEYVYKTCGFGRLDLDGLGESGGHVQAPSSHYVWGWRARQTRPSAEPICYFTSGWLCGALSAIYDKPVGYYGVEETRCAAMGEAACGFTLTADACNHQVFQPFNDGNHLSERHKIRPIPPNNLDYDGVYEAVSGMDLSGNNDGIVPAFGVYLTHHYANYYCRISFELLSQMQARFGDEGREVAELLLMEAGRICSFQTGGGIMISDEWDALVRPTLKTKEDWMHGIMAIMNAFGWGRYQVVDVSEHGAEFIIHDDYESIGYLNMYGKSDYPVSFLPMGGLPGLVTLVYVAGIENKPTLNAEFYRSIFTQARTYESTCLSSKAMGDEVTHIKITI